MELLFFRTIAIALLLLLLVALPSLSLAALTFTSEERAQCQCTVNGRSANTNVFYNSGTWSTYRSTNIDTGASPYEFIGCGAHKFYYDSSINNQVAGYPWKLCYTYGGKNGCRITELSQKHSLNNAIAYRFCNGDYDCNAKANLYVQVGTVAAALILDETDTDGNLQDWTNCCQECRLHRRSDEGADTTNCIAWDFSVETMECRLFSHADRIATPNATTSSSSAPYWFYGTPGFDDAPVHCWRRNRYDTCRANFKAFFIASMVLGSISLSLIIFFYCYLDTVRCYGWTTDVTPGPPRRETRTSSGKGGSRTYQVTIYPALLVCQIKGDMRREHVTSESAIIRDKKFFFYTLKGGTRFVGMGHIFAYAIHATWIFVLFSLPSIGFLLAVSFQVFLTNGGRFQAKYLLPGSNSDNAGTVWGFVACCSTIVLALAVPFLCRLQSWSQTACFRSEDIYIKPGSTQEDSESDDDDDDDDDVPQGSIFMRHKWFSKDSS